VLTRRAGRAAQRGVSLVELMVGLALGLVLLAGALALYASVVVNGRRVYVETRVNQNLRAAADLIERDLRRAGYWANADTKGTFPIGSGTLTLPNPYAAVATPAASRVDYSFLLPPMIENDTLDAAKQFGFRLNAKAIEMQLGAGQWQPVTDASVVEVTAFQISSQATVIPMSALCAQACPAATPNCATSPTGTVRRYDVLLTGRAVRDPTVVRSLELSVRPRNDALSGFCLS
jgi:prepilin peptidase dependent protein B